MNQLIAEQIMILLAAGVTAVLLFKRLGLGSVLAYLTVGVLVGPSGINVVRDTELISQLSELGVVMLLFVIGLELSRERLRSMKDSVFVLGPLQVALSALVISALAWIWLPPGAAILLGMAFSLSSTALALQLLKERSLLSTPAGQGGFGILLFQDLAVIPMLAVLPLLGAGSGAGTAGDQALAVGKAVGMIAIVLVVGKYLLRPVLRTIAATGVKEAFTATALLLVLGVAAAMHSVGLSAGLGAFLAGILLAESEYRHELEVDIEPFKGLLLGLFFIAAGMSLNLAIVGENILLVTGVTAGAMTAKFLIILAIARFRRIELSQGLLMGFSLSQIGEFALVLFATGKMTGIIDGTSQTVLGAVVILSMTLSPLLMKLWDGVIAPRMRTQAAPTGLEPPAQSQGHVIIAGVGRIGQIIARILNAQGWRTVILEHDPSQIQLLQQFGYTVYYGDATRLDLLEAAGAESARLMIVAVDNPETTLAVTSLVRDKFPHLPLVVRARNRQTVFDLIDLGVTDAVRETLDGSLEMAQSALRKLGMSAYRSYRVVERFKVHDQSVLMETAARRKIGQHAVLSYVASARAQLEELMRADIAERDELADDHWG